MKIYFYFLVLLLVPGVLNRAKPARGRRDWGYWDTQYDASTKPTVAPTSTAISITTCTTVAIIIKKDEVQVIFALKSTVGAYSQFLCKKISQKIPKSLSKEFTKISCGDVACLI